MRIRLVGIVLLDFLGQHALDALQNGVDIRLRLLALRVGNEHSSVVVSIRDNALDLLHGHQTLHQIPLEVERVELIFIGVQQVDGASEWGWTTGPGQGSTDSIDEVALVVADNYHGLLGAGRRRKGGNERMELVSSRSHFTHPIISFGATTAHSAATKSTVTVIHLNLSMLLVVLVAGKRFAFSSTVCAGTLLKEVYNNCNYYPARDEFCSGSLDGLMAVSRYS